jgi:hypothetical protein
MALLYYLTFIKTLTPVIKVTIVTDIHTNMVKLLKQVNLI